ncbi:FAD-dependent 5-carboxymethylaminomethyl-2-thiouridine(34) oxidoreductase MnmC [Sneathiella marina]|uniref:FAD-dependent 5-carboxymethylaminomethyl-2-thiouridine(34) oxidoreductase MnmC n=1 Tax=Sneathiella marina TaxID=2950108 RepID=A0ABY4WAL6_9PROT|nr:FAD-dependent 5-carboxymethylaminomethyl-2-thiouridine(34) oxidoreductase MnmC [Sneathiella marina]USG63188.1 FAD-dependent 5-carboxymethylaminomethyl-2-thiouridine(34) oxidoreductase MnmC [Sneathiella marina]
MKVAILGGGMAGCALAHILRQSGAEPVLYEAGPALASGASGNECGLYNPRFSALRSAESDFYAAAYAQALCQFQTLEGIDWTPCGSLHLMTSDKIRDRLRRTQENWGWEAAHMRLVSRIEASEIAGIELRHDALYLPEGGYVSPKKLCAAYARNIEVHLNAEITDLAEIDAPVTVLACGPAVAKFAPTLPLIPVRGQITQVAATARSAALNCNLCHSGYMTPAHNGEHTLGATFQPDTEDSDLRAEDDQENIDRLAEIIPGLESGLTVTGQRASVRATSRNRFPIIGALPGHDHVYMSAAHGSYGILSSLMSAHLLTDMILNRPRCLPTDVIKALSPTRFKKRG